MQLIKAKILINEKIRVKADFYLMELLAPALAAEARPGQFMMLTAVTGESPFLKRPMGINAINRDRGTLRVIYKLAGKGTKAMSRLKAGERIDILGPLGNGWKIGPAAMESAVLVGGGSGIATLLPLAQELERQGIAVDIILGGQSAEHIICVEEFSHQGRSFIATEDGTMGEKGRIDIFFSDEPHYDMAYVCGPLPMMKKAAAWAMAYDVPCQVSLEERMGCGFGVCMGCVCEHRDGEGDISYQRVCREGPVFWAKEVFFHG